MKFCKLNTTIEVGTRILPPGTILLSIFEFPDEYLVRYQDGSEEISFAVKPNDVSPFEIPESATGIDVRQLGYFKYRETTVSLVYSNLYRREWWEISVNGFITRFDFEHDARAIFESTVEKIINGDGDA